MLLFLKKGTSKITKQSNQINRPIVILSQIDKPSAFERGNCLAIPAFTHLLCGNSANSKQLSANHEQITETSIYMRLSNFDAPWWELCLAYSFLGLFILQLAVQPAMELSRINVIKILKIHCWSPLKMHFFSR